MPAEQQIFVLEVVVHRVELEPQVTIHSLEGLNLNFKFSQRVNFDIDTQYFASPEVELGTGGKEINMNYGKTFLFIATPTELRQLLQIEPYQISLLDGNKVLGTAVVNWKKDFPDMVKAFNSSNEKKTEYRTIEDKYEMKNDHEQRTAKVKMFIRMTCFGPNIQVMFQLIGQEGFRPEVLFRQKDLSKTFVVDRYNDTRATVTVKEESLIDIREDVGSLTDLFGRNGGQKLSAAPDTGSGGVIDMDFGDYDAESLCYRPSENKFFNFLNVISANVKTHGKNTCITLQKTKAVHGKGSIMVSKSFGGAARQSRNTLQNTNVAQPAAPEDEDGIVHATAEQIRQKLCGNMDCPAVKKFIEYGICEPAVDNRLGELVEPPVTKGLRHVYKTLSNYGEYSSPKYEELPFVPFKPIKPIKYDKKRKLEKKSKEQKKEQWHSETCPLFCEKSRDEKKKKSKSSKSSC